MGTTINTFTNASGANQPFIGSGGGKMIDNFSTNSDFVAGNTDPYTALKLFKINTIQMTVGGTSGATNAARIGIWRLPNTVFDYSAFTLNGVTATVNSATATANVVVDCIVASGTTYYAGAWGNTSICARRDTNTGSFSGYSGGTTSTTVSATYNPGNLNFILRYYYLPNAPTGVTVTSKTSTSATISWTASSDPGGVAASTLRYKVKWTNASGGSDNFALIESAAGATSATISGLTPGETYQFYVAAMNTIIPTTGNSYSSDDGTVYVDTYSSGPWSTASAATTLPGGRYDGTAWKPFTSARRLQFPSTSFTNGQVAPLSSTATIYFTSSTQPNIAVGNRIVISGTAGLAGFDGTWTVTSIGGTTNNWSVSFNQGYFNSSPTTPAFLTTQGTATTYAPATIRVYNSSNTWSTFYTSN